MELPGWELKLAPGGWVKVVNLDDGRTAYLQLRETRDADGNTRMNTHAAIMTGEKPVSVHAWRNVPISQIERLLTPTGVPVLDFGPMDIVREPAPKDAPSLDGLDEYFNRDHERLVIKQAAPSPVAAPRPAPLGNPKGKITDDFLKDLAGTYRWLVSTGEASPAPVIAEQTGAPTRTVQRWISTARKRGILPPGRPGRAG